MAQAVYIINGPNLNLLGSREPEIYGTTTLADIESACASKLDSYDLPMSFFQSNDEGELVSIIQTARSQASGVIINAAAYSHTSVAILDALQSLSQPIIEVHLSNIYARESFRHHSHISQVATGVICGLGAQGYEMAIGALAKRIKP